MTDDFQPALIDDDTDEADGEPTGPDAIPDVREDEVPAEIDPAAETAGGTEPE